MSAQASARLIKAANPLLPRARRGRGLTVEDMVRAAEQALESHGANARARMLAAIADARAAIARRTDGAERAALIAKLAAMAGEGEAQGRVLGNPLLADVSARLGAFVALFAKTGVAAPDAKAATALALHLDAMIVALDRRQDALDDEGRTLLDNLELTERTIKTR